MPEGLFVVVRFVVVFGLLVVVFFIETRRKAEAKIRKNNFMFESQKLRCNSGIGLIIASSNYR